MTIDDAYKRGRPNALNGIRLLLAVGVVFWHSFALTGTAFDGGDPAQQLLGNVFVDGFFGVSGYLIAMSWVRTPRVGAFLTARVLRIFPGFWTCLIITAVILAPLSAAVAGGTGWQLLATLGPYEYVFKNAGLWIFQRGIEGTLLTVPYPDAWNGSLWTLAWEFLCYLGVLALGIAGLISRKSVLWGLFAAVWLATLTTAALGWDSETLHNALRFAMMFLAGTLLAAYSSQVRISGWAIVVSAGVVAASCWLPDYRLVAALPLAYLLVALGGFVSRPRLQFKNDTSFGIYIYAFPVQQLLASAGGAALGVWWFSLIATAVTVPLAIASWFLVEKRALRFKTLGRSTKQARISGSPTRGRSTVAP